MTSDSEIFLDTNILVYYTFKDFEPVRHKECRELVDTLKKKDIGITISTQILREFYAVVTGKKYFKTPLEPEAAKNQILYFSAAFKVVDVNQDVISRLTNLIEKYGIKGQKIHDATIVATMLHTGNSTLVSYNRRDFIDFKEIKTTDPRELLKTMEERESYRNEES